MFLYALVTVCCTFEGVLTLSDIDMILPEHLRSFVYYYGAFWPGLLDNWKPNYAAQPYLMFITHVFLHTGLVHLTVNMITLCSLGSVVLNRVGQGRFIFLYTISALGGGIGFAYLAENLQPMVGASGALFGLLGAILAWEFQDSREDREALRYLAVAIFLLIVLNLVYWWAMKGQLAWQAHLGGFLFGGIAAIAIGRRTPDDENPTKTS
ncbi:rhomboid family intramembrane serine protease [Sulfitobacter sp. F26169L]|uniref:rhomboid family intramembrane serine protease n=1 Tax=Sulfitobacter sp. F26169L TaxID=2996015 RepID=UPI0022608F74|nr:rhomboid family intramembrane serine protease [Sulfitobacter sp. F26169L]MCX7567499.1 rhomboid family intramembrane serine protease [Sulfitobacter sp. F26169L]